MVVRELLVGEHALHHGGWSDVVVAHLVRPRGDGGVEVREAASRLPGAPGGRARHYTFIINGSLRHTGTVIIIHTGVSFLVVWCRGRWLPLLVPNPRFSCTS